VSLSAGGGAAGHGAITGGTANPGGAGGTSSATGITATTHPGTAGGAGGNNGVAPTGGVNDTTNNVGCGGGGGAYTGWGFNSGKGGNSNTVTGGAASAGAGNTPADATAGNGGAGGSGGNSAVGGNGGNYGGGGGGGGTYPASSAGGAGGSGYTLVEWTNVVFPGYDATGPGYVSTTNAPTINASTTHTATAGATVFVGVYTQLAAGNGNPTSWTRTVTYGGTAMTSLGVIDLNNSHVGWIELFKLANVPGGAQTIAVTVTGGTGTFNITSIGSVSYLNVGSIGTPITNLGAGTALSSGAVSSSPGQMVAQIFGASYNGGTATSSIAAYNQTSRYAQNITAAACWGGILMGDVSGALSGSFTATCAASPAWGSIAVSLLQ
jgi:hypothetical protein